MKSEKKGENIIIDVLFLTVDFRLHHMVVDIALFELLARDVVRRPAFFGPFASLGSKE
jgi:hypothetical protein